MFFTRKNSVQIAIYYLSETINRGDVMKGNRDLADVIGIGLPKLREAMAILKTRGIIQIEHGKKKIVISDPLGSEEHY